MKTNVNNDIFVTGGVNKSFRYVRGKTERESNDHRSTSGRETARVTQRGRKETKWKVTNYVIASFLYLLRQMLYQSPTPSQPV